MHPYRAYFLFASTSLLIVALAYIMGGVRYALGFGVLLALVLLVFTWVSSRSADLFASTLFGGSREKEHKLILKGYYEQANGYKMTSQLSMAENVYRTILAEYPDELDAWFFLGELLHLKMNDPRKAHGIFKELKRKIREKNPKPASYKYWDVLNHYIEETKTA